MRALSHLKNNLFILLMTPFLSSCSQEFKSHIKGFISFVEMGYFIYTEDQKDPRNQMEGFEKWKVERSQTLSKVSLILEDTALKIHRNFLKREEEREKLKRFIRLYPRALKLEIYDMDKREFFFSYEKDSYPVKDKAIDDEAFKNFLEYSMYLNDSNYDVVNNIFITADTKNFYNFSKGNNYKHAYYRERDITKFNDVYLFGVNKDRKLAAVENFIIFLKYDLSEPSEKNGYAESDQGNNQEKQLKAHPSKCIDSKSRLIIDKEEFKEKYGEQNSQYCEETAVERKYKSIRYEFRAGAFLAYKEFLDLNGKRSGIENELKKLADELNLKSNDFFEKQLYQEQGKNLSDPSMLLKGCIWKLEQLKKQKTTKQVVNNYEINRQTQYPDVDFCFKTAERLKYR